MRDYCGVYGVYNCAGKDSAKAVYYGLFALQHRGQESAGIACSDGKDIKSHKGMGLVNQVFNEDRFKKLNGYAAIGHVRYSTTGSSIIENAQPIVIDTRYGPIALAHNGNLINSIDLRQDLMDKGISFMGTTDSEVIAAMVATSSREKLEDALIETLQKCRGAFALVLMAHDRVIAVRDPNGIRPLCIGKTEDAFVVSSETCALDIIGAEYVRDVTNGEIVIINADGIQSKTWDISQPEALCVFEYIYLARPDSVLSGRNVYDVRFNMGKYLSKEHPADAEMVMPIPESGVPASIGFANESEIPYGEGLIKNRYIGRTFIQPNQAIREQGVKVKLNPIKDSIRGKKIVVLDDSIVRGTTSRQIVRLIREAGAREIHFRVSSPPIISPCFYGVDTPTKAELVAANLSVKGIEKYLEVDSLGYLSIKNLIRAVSLPKDRLCMACFNGEYPVKVSEKMTSLKLFFK